MFSGKSEELIRRCAARRSHASGAGLQAEIDNAFKRSHRLALGDSSRIVKRWSVEELMAQVRPDTEVIGIDEGQFFGNELIDVRMRSSQRDACDHRRPRSGLHRQALGANAPTTRGRRIYNEDARDLHEVRQPANYSQRTFESEERVAVGARTNTKPAAAAALFRTLMHRRFMRLSCTKHSHFLKRIFSVPDSVSSVSCGERGQKTFSSTFRPARDSAATSKRSSLPAAPACVAT